MTSSIGTPNLLPVAADKPRRLRVLMIIPTLDRSGAEKQLTLLATRLPPEQFEVRVFALTRGGPYAQELLSHDIPVRVFRKRFKFDPLLLWRLRCAIHEERPDILHTWLFAGNAYGRLAVGARPSCPVVVSERCVDTWKSGWQLWLDRRMVPRTTRLVANSQSVAAFYRHVGYPAEKVQVIVNGVDAAPARAAPEVAGTNPLGPTRAELLEKLELPADCRIIGYVGRLARQKRVEDLVWAFELLRMTEPRVAFVVIGDGPERSRLEGFAGQLRMHAHIRFLGHRDDVSQFWPLLDVFWLASDFEGQSNSLMEAMSAGIPAVVSDIPPNRELVIPEQSGFVVPVGDRAEFTRQTLTLLHEPELARRLGIAAQARIRDEFSVDRMVAGYASLYREVLAMT